MHLINNVICYTLTNIMIIDEKINAVKKNEVNINKAKQWELSQ